MTAGSRSSQINLLERHNIGVEPPDNSGNALRGNISVQPDATVHIVGHGSQAANGVRQANAPGLGQSFATEDVEDGGAQGGRPQKNFRTFRNSGVGGKENKTTCFLKARPSVGSALKG